MMLPFRKNLSVHLIVPVIILLCAVCTSCISEEILIERYNTNSTSYANLIGPFKRIIFFYREETVNADRLKKFEIALRAKCAKHGTAIFFTPYKTDDGGFSATKIQVNDTKKTDFIVRLSHTGQFLRKTVPDPFHNIRQKNSFRVERVAFYAMGYIPGENKPLWKGSFSATNTSIPAVDEQAVARLYNRMLKDGILQ